MSDFSRIEGIAAPLPIANLDTDQIMPKQFLLGTDKSGLAAGLLYDLRFDAGGAARPECVLNQPEYVPTRILVGGANFGCGSSREHAVWGLQQWGIAAVLAPSFGEIFYYNAMNNRLLAIVLAPQHIQTIMEHIARPTSNQLRIDVERGEVRTDDGRTFGFEMQPRHRRMVLEGLDVLGASLTLTSEIDAFEQRQQREQPWLRVL